MADYWRPRSKKRSRRWFWAVLAPILIAIFFFARQNLLLNQRRLEQKNRIAELEAEQQLLEREKNELEQQLEVADRDDFLERVARERLNLKRPDERVVVFEVEPGLVAAEEAEIKPGFWSRFKARIFSFFQRQ